MGYATHSYTVRFDSMFARLAPVSQNFNVQLRGTTGDTELEVNTTTEYAYHG